MGILESRLPTLVKNFNNLMDNLHEEGSVYDDYPSAFEGEDGQPRGWNPSVLSAIADLVADAALSLEMDRSSSTPASPALTLGQRLRKARERAGHEQKDVAFLLGLNNTKRLSEIETGGKRPPQALIPRIEDYIAKYDPAE